MEANKKIGIAVVLWVVAAGLFFVIRGATDQDVEPPFVVESMPNLDRIELDVPRFEGGMKRVVLERRERQWWLSSPVEERMDRRKAEEFTAVFGNLRIGDFENEDITDETYGLSEDRAVRVSLMESGTDRGSQKFLVGNQAQISQTGEVGTYIRPVDQDRVYRARGAFGDLVRTPVHELRERSVISVGQEGIESVHMTHADGHQVGVELRGDTWEISDSMSNVQIDQRRAARLASTLGRLDSVGFFEGTAEEVGLDNPAVVVEMVTGLETVRLEVATMVTGDRTRYFVRREGDSRIYEVSREDGQLLTTRLSGVRDRAIVGVGSPVLSKIELAGEDGVRLQRGRQGWTMERPRGVALDQEKAMSLARFVAGLRAEDWVEEEIDFHNSEVEIMTILIGIDGHDTTLTIGPPVPGVRGARYATYSEESGIFVVSRETVNRLTTDARALSVEDDG